MSRVQLALNVDDIDEAVSFYTALFGTGPAKRRPGYANFAVTEPPPGQLNHRGALVEAGDDGAPVAQRGEQRAGAAAGVEDPPSGHVPG